MRSPSLATLDDRFFVGPKSDILQGGRAVNPGDSPFEARIFDTYDYLTSTTPLAGMALTLVTRTEDFFHPAVSLAHSRRGSVTIFEDMSSALRDLSSSTCGERFLLIDVDGEDIDTIVSGLVDFRVAHPDHRVILASREFRDFDFSQDRLAIGDASLRVPFGFKAAEIAFRAADDNNKRWRQRIGAPGTLQRPVIPFDEIDIPSRGGRQSEVVQELAINLAGVHALQDTTIKTKQVERQVDLGHEYGCDDKRLPSGWWILPSVLLGVLIWLAIFWALLKALT